MLSKPRIWHKLTDKGREAFRRIYGWLCDDVAIELLCTMSPRRVAMPCDKIEHPPKESYYEDYKSSESNESINNNNNNSQQKQQSPSMLSMMNWQNNDEEILTSSEGEDEKEYLKSVIDLQVYFFVINKILKKILLKFKFITLHLKFKIYNKYLTLF